MFDPNLILNVRFSEQRGYMYILIKVIFKTNLFIRFSHFQTYDLKVVHDLYYQQCLTQILSKMTSNRDSEGVVSRKSLNYKFLRSFLILFSFFFLRKHTDLWQVNGVTRGTACENVPKARTKHKQPWRPVWNWKALYMCMICAIWHGLQVVP
jgi:hypothetical protein